MKIDAFLLAMLGAVLLALLFPTLGASGGPLHLDIVTTVGIAFVFFLHGANLSPASLKAGATHWKLHLFVQSSTFLLFPALGAGLFFASDGLMPLEARLGLFFLCALPSTISSSVAMTALGRGNVPGAIFNATLSGLIGMVVTPLLMSLVIGGGTGHSLPLIPAIVDIMQTLLLPLLAGQILRRWIGGFITRHKAWVSKADRTVIVLIVFAAFSESTAAGVWSRYDPLLIVTIALCVATLLGMVVTLTTWAARAFGFRRADEVAAVFCGSKKSLANGAPIAAVLFAGNPALGMIMLPVMLYHQMQLILCTVLARRYARAAEIAAGAEVVEAAVA
jgi:sodium/bile acid cotransporter 7